MKIGKVTLTAAAIALASAPIAGQAIAADRAVAPVSGESELGGGASLAIVFLLAAFVAGIWIAGDDDEPVSA